MRRLVTWFGLAAVLSGLAPGALFATGEFELYTLEQPQRTRLADPPLLLEDFVLTGHDGREARFSGLRGDAALVFFGFTNCPSVCPAAMQTLRQVRNALADELEDESAVPLGVLVSVDGERDTPEAVKEFIAPFGAGFVGFTGPPREVRSIANAFSAVFFKGGPTDTEGGYNVEHTSQIYLVDAEGYLRATFYSAPVRDMVEVARHIIQ